MRPYGCSGRSTCTGEREHWRSDVGSPVLHRTSIGHPDDVDRLAVDIVTETIAASPSDPCYGTIARFEEVLDCDALGLVGGVVRVDDMCEALWASPR